MSKESSIKVFAENASGTRPANAIPVWIDNISAIGGGGGGSDFDPTYMSAQIDNKLNTTAFNSVSGQFQPKSAMSNYVTNSDLDYTLEIERESINADKVSNSAVGFYKTWGLTALTGISGKDISAKSAYKANTATVAYTAQTAYYDSNGNYLSQTYDNLTALNQFVQSNSANWEGGSSPAGGEGVLFHKYTYQPSDGGKGSTDSFVANASDLYFEACVDTNYPSPNNIIIEHNGSFVGEAYWTQVSSDGSYNYYTASYNGLPNGEYKLNNNGYDAYSWCYVSAKGVRTDAFNQGQYKGSTDKTVKLNVQGYNITGTIDGINHGSFTPITSFTGSLTDFTAKGYEEYSCNINADDYYSDSNYNISAEFEEGSTVASGDVFPPTNNLDPYATYYLGWNANNGGLQWFYQGGNGN